MNFKKLKIGLGFAWRFLLAALLLAWFVAFIVLRDMDYWKVGTGQPFREIQK